MDPSSYLVLSSDEEVGDLRTPFKLGRLEGAKVT